MPTESALWIETILYCARIATGDPETLARVQSKWAVEILALEAIDQ